MSAPSTLLAGRYRLDELIAAGGMGVVRKGWDELLERPVAVKQLRTEVGVPEQEAELAKQRGMREARITARLHHPHAVLVFDAVESEGQPCLIMQYLPSTSLSAVLRERGPLPLAESARIGAEVASALVAAHRLGIVHRDVKPGNVLIADDDGRALISDFGISHALGDATLTSTGLVHGTPAFLAPEVARGEDSSFASDVFSLGSTLYTAVEGVPPFGADANSIAMLHRVAQGRFEPPQHAGPLAPLLAEMLSSRPDARPSMRAVADRLVTLQGSAEEAAPPAGSAASPGPRARLAPGVRPTAILTGVGRWFEGRLQNKERGEQLPGVGEAPATAIIRDDARTDEPTLHQGVPTDPSRAEAAPVEPTSRRPVSGVVAHAVDWCRRRSW